MEVGLLTSPFAREPLENVLKFAGPAGFDALEVHAGPGSPHIDPSKLTAAEARKAAKAVEAAGLRISSLAFYGNITAADPKEAQANVEHLKKVIDAAAKLGVDIVCANAGQPQPGLSREETIKQHTAKVYRKLAPYAAKKGIKIALENWFATNMQNMPQWELLFDLVPEENFGLNFDPSHLAKLFIDWLAAVDQWGPRIFHTHAKDTEIREHDLRRIGHIENGWWRFTIPGYGLIDWGVYIARLRRIGYNNVLSIEHEDSALGREEGFLKGLQHLRQFA